MNKKDTVRICGWDIDRDVLLGSFFQVIFDATKHPDHMADVVLNTEDGSLSIKDIDKGDYDHFSSADISLWCSEIFDFWDFLDNYVYESLEKILRSALDDKTVDAYLDNCNDDCNDDDERRDALVRCYDDHCRCVDQFIANMDNKDEINENIDLDSITDEANFSYEVETVED